MLTYVYGACTGIRHRSLGECGGDSALAMYVDDTLYFSISDGAGSSSLSHRVADVITYESVRLMIGGVAVRDVPLFLAPMIREIFSGIDKRELYATLVIGMYKRGKLSYISIGDSVLLWRKGNVWHASEVVKGEFANETVFLLSDGWKEMMITDEVSGVDAIFVSSDGLGGAYFFYKMLEDRWYVEPSHEYLNKLVEAVNTGELSFDNVGDLLCSDSLMEFNDDDKSVVIAYVGL